MVSVSGSTWSLVSAAGRLRLVLLLTIDALRCSHQAGKQQRVEQPGEEVVQHRSSQRLTMVLSTAFAVTPLANHHALAALGEAVVYVHVLPAIRPEVPPQRGEHVPVHLGLHGPCFSCSASAAVVVMAMPCNVGAILSNRSSPRRSTYSVTTLR